MLRAYRLRFEHQFHCTSTASKPDSGTAASTRATTRYTRQDRL
jgi:hypothetical protein